MCAHLKRYLGGNRMRKLFSAAEMVEWMRGCVGQPYWYGTYWNKCTKDLHSRKAKQYPSHYGASRTSRYNADIAAGRTAADCVGGIKGAAWGMLGAHAPKYASGGVPDKSADGMFAWCKEHGADWGAIKTIPERVGVAVRFAGHIGIYAGGGKALEWRGFAHGMVITNLKDRPWTHWCELPWVEYAAGAPQKPPAGVTLGARLLRRGMAGDDVEALQTLLMMLGHALPKYGADGDFGAETEKALKAFQARERLKVDGVYGAKSHAALMGVIAEQEAQHEEPEVQPSPTRFVVFSGGDSYIRAGAGTAHKIITVGKRGARLPWVATADNGWHAVEVDGKHGWASGKYTTVE